VLEIVPATIELAESLAASMRQSDRDECWAASKQLPLESLLYSMAHSVDCKAALFKGEVGAIYGVAPMALLSPHGCIWMLTSALVEKNRRLFLRGCRSEISRMLTIWPVLFNFIDARYTVALRWANWLGAKVFAPAPFGVLGMPFCRVVWEA
jgi:hypothetical protein